MNRHDRFRQLHAPGQPFVLVNVSDIGGARVMQALGAAAIATSSAALAYTLGKPDGTLTRDEALRHAADLAASINIPVSGDLENGYGDSPDAVAETIRLAAAAGLSGASIEDTALPAQTPYVFDLAVDRIAAAATAARQLPHDFVLVARADGVMTGAYDIAEARRRLAAFEQAGADCLYAPLLPFDALAALCQETALPVNALIAGENCSRRQSEFAKIGVARLSLGSSLARATHRLLHDAATAMLSGDADFSALTHTISGDKIDRLLTKNNKHGSK